MVIRYRIQIKTRLEVLKVMTDIQNWRLWSYIHYNTSIILISTGWFGNSSLCNASVRFLVPGVIRCWRPWKGIARRTPESSRLDQCRIVGTHQSASGKGENPYSVFIRKAQAALCPPGYSNFCSCVKLLLFIPSAEMYPTTTCTWRWLALHDVSCLSCVAALTLKLPYGTIPKAVEVLLYTPDSLFQLALKWGKDNAKV